MEDEKKTIESFPMKGGDGPYSYNKNSVYQRGAISVVKTMIYNVIAEKFDIKHHLLTTNTFRIADLGCSIGPNTFISMQNIIEAVEFKFHSEVLDAHIPEFQVFFNDHTSNDFNTLFTSLPPERRYLAAGVPGSFHGRLFPKASLHFVHSSHALHWLSMVPKEVKDQNSPAWNKGKIHYINASNEVREAYQAQFAKDIGSFLYARAEELVPGGMMTICMPGLPNGTDHSKSTAGIIVEPLGYALMDMAMLGIVSEAKVDSFNLPIYSTCPQEFEGLVERNGCFSIERMETLPHFTGNAVKPNAQMWSMCLRAGIQGPIIQHFGSEIMDELFKRYEEKILESSLMDPSQKADQLVELIVILKRK